MASPVFSGDAFSQAGHAIVHVLQLSLIDNGVARMKAFIWAVAACVVIGVVAGVIMTGLDGAQTLGSVRLD